MKITRKNVQRLISWAREAGNGTKIVVSFVEQEINRNEVEEFRSFWENEGADFVVIRRMHSNAAAVSSIAKQLHDQNAGEERRPCLYPWERMTLTPRGFLAFCPQDWVNGSDLVDFRHSTIRETWQSDLYRNLRQAHLNNDFSCHSFCGKCPDWKQTRWPGTGRSYADMIEDFQQDDA